MRLSNEDHEKVTLAVTRAEATTDGEIVTVVARQSDKYHDVALHWSVLAMLLVLALLAAFPGMSDAITGLVVDPWAADVSATVHYLIALVVVTLTFLICRVALAWRPLRLALTPGATKTRRVRAKAMELFRAGAEKRTIGATGVLLYLSIAEHRAEIIADEAIHSRVSQEMWGHAMASLVTAVRDGRPGDGMADAVTEIGAVLTEHFPRSEGDTNELPDRLIEL